VVITGSTDLDGTLLDASDSAGTSGQVLSSTGTGVQWISSSSGGTFPNDITIGTSSAVDDDSIFFDDGSKSLTWDNALSEFEFNTELSVAGALFLNGDLSVGEEFGNDNNTIFFDEESNPAILEWDDSDDRFEFNNELAIAGPLLVGSNTNTPVSYSRLTSSSDTTSHGLSAFSDLLIGASLEVDGPSFFDSQTTITATNPTTPFIVNLLGSDGGLVNFERNGGFVGGIDVASGTVTYGAFTGSHYAWADEYLSVGMLVSMTGNNQYLGDPSQSEIIYGITKSSQKNDPAILGAYLATKISPVVLEIDNVHIIMADGNGDVWVADTGEDIHPGDYLISSSVAGHAMKDDRSEELSHIIGRAAEPIDWSEVKDTIEGVKHKKISILFNFVPLNNNIVE